MAPELVNISIISVGSKGPYDGELLRNNYEALSGLLYIESV
jgi:hypothetical protein